MKLKCSRCQSFTAPLVSRKLCNVTARPTEKPHLASLEYFSLAPNPCVLLPIGLLLPAQLHKHSNPTYERPRDPERSSRNFEIICSLIIYFESNWWEIAIKIELAAAATASSSCLEPSERNGRECKLTGSTKKSNRNRIIRMRNYQSMQRCDTNPTYPRQKGIWNSLSGLMAHPLFRFTALVF